MMAKGDYVAANGSLVSNKKLVFWGEWEPPSNVTALPWSPSDLMPRWLHRPCFPVPAPPAAAGLSSGFGPVRSATGGCGGCATSAGGGPQNTDPFVFGPCFKYFVCKQFQRQRSNRAVPLARKTWLADLDAGSVILFGSTQGRGKAAFFQLDTVFVVGESIPYSPKNPAVLPPHCLVDPDFLKTSFQTALPVTDCEVPDDLKLRLYLGATPEKPCHGMYSFSPARVSEGAPTGFPRVRLREQDLKLPGHSSFLTNNLNSAPRKREISKDEAAALWQAVLDQCRAQGCVPGVRFHLRPQP